MFGDLIGTVLRPSPTMADLAEASPRRGLAPVIIAGLCWAALSALLGASGHEPSRPLIGGGAHYFAQAVFVTPLFLLSWVVLCATSAAVARLYGAAVTAKDLAAACAHAYAVPLVLTWALPDAVVFLAAGFDALGPLVRLVGSATALYMAGLTALAVRSVTGLPWPRAVVAALAGLVAQALVGGWALR